MANANDIISDLMHALELIRREADKPTASRHYIDGVAAFAMAKCDAQRERNSDGYLVVKENQ
jgi:hypothetical protein